MDKPYIGVTGVTNLVEAQIVAETFEANKLDLYNPSYFPMIGVLVSGRTLIDVPPRKLLTPNIKYPNWRLVKPIFDRVKDRAFTMVHYTTKEIDTLPEQIIHLFRDLYRETEDGGLYETGVCEAVQLNVPWPQPVSLERILKEFPEMKIVLQLSKTVMQGISPDELSKKVLEYKGLVAYALLDPSGGRGIEFDPEQSVEVYRAIKERSPDLMLGFAGGFNGDNVFNKVNQLREMLGKEHFCIDAEGGLRNNHDYIDCLDLDNIRGYIHGAVKAFSCPLE